MCRPSRGATPSPPGFQRAQRKPETGWKTAYLKPGSPTITTTLPGQNGGRGQGGYLPPLHSLSRGPTPHPCASQTGGYPLPLRTFGSGVGGRNRTGWGVGYDEKVWGIGGLEGAGRAGLRGGGYTPFGILTTKQDLIPLKQDKQLCFKYTFIL